MSTQLEAERLKRIACAAMDAASGSTELRTGVQIGRDLMRLESARQALEDEISRLRQLQRGIVS